jgi:hypothetical protein
MAIIKTEKVHLKVSGDLVPVGDNVVATLDEQLAKKIFQHHASAAENNAYKALYAAAIKKAHSNSATDAMSDTFKSWYKKFKLERAYGTPKNFQHWVKAGQAIERHRKLFGEDLIDLPLQRGISAMEELSGWSDAEVRIAMEHAWRRDNLTTSIEDLRKIHGTKPKKPVIHATASAGSLKAWKEAWTNPQPKPTKDPHRLNFIEIKAANNVLYFDNKTAQHQGKTNLQNLETIQSKILEVLKRFEADGHIRITSHLETVKTAHAKKEQQAKDAVAKASAKKKNVMRKSKSKSKAKKPR